MRRFIFAIGCCWLIVVLAPFAAYADVWYLILSSIQVPARWSLAGARSVTIVSIFCAVIVVVLQLPLGSTATSTTTDLFALMFNFVYSSQPLMSFRIELNRNLLSILSVIVQSCAACLLALLVLISLLAEILIKWGILNIYVLQAAVDIANVAPRLVAIGLLVTFRLMLYFTR